MSGTTGWSGSKHWWVDLVIGIAIIWGACVGLEAMATATSLPSQNETDQALATALAEGERARIDGLPFDALLPTDGFVAPSWIDHQDLEQGQVALVTQPETHQSTELYKVYSVTWKVENLDRHGALRRATISVQWRKGDGSLGRVLTSTIRAGADPA